MDKIYDILHIVSKLASIRRRQRELYTELDNTIDELVAALEAAVKKEE